MLKVFLSKVFIFRQILQGTKLVLWGILIAIHLFKNQQCKQPCTLTIPPGIRWTRRPGWMKLEECGGKHWDGPTKRISINIPEWKSWPRRDQVTSVAGSFTHSLPVSTKTVQWLFYSFLLFLKIVEARSLPNLQNEGYLTVIRSLCSSLVEYLLIYLLLFCFIFTSL